MQSLSSHQKGSRQDGLGCEILGLNRMLNLLAMIHCHYFTIFVIRGAQFTYAHPSAAFHQGKCHAQKCENLKEQEIRDSLQLKIQS